MLGYTHEEMLKMEPLEIATEYHDPPLEKVLNDLRTIGRARFETGHRRKDGTIVPVEVNSHVVGHLGKKITIGVVRDITESKHNVDALKLANKKLNLLSSISRHDLINQLTPLTGYLALLELEQKGAAPSSESYLKKAMASADRIYTMVQFTKEYENIGVNAPIWQDIGSLIESATKEVQLNNVRIVSEIAVGTEIYADPLIQKVFFNLIDNAMRYGVHITTIRFFREGSDGRAIFICEDDGGGIPEEMKEKLFTRGFGKNHGFGLFLSREILAITGITLTEEGETGKGARFVLTIPHEGIRRTRA